MAGAMTGLRFHEKRTWSVVAGGMIARLSIYDAHGGEHFAIVPVDVSGKAWREKRDQALERIAETLDSDPGAVDLDLYDQGIAA